MLVEEAVLRGHKDPPRAFIPESRIDAGPGLHEGKDLLHGKTLGQRQGQVGAVAGEPFLATKVQ